MIMSTRGRHRHRNNIIHIADYMNLLTFPHLNIIIPKATCILIIDIRQINGSMINLDHLNDWIGWLGHISF